MGCRGCFRSREDSSASQTLRQNEGCPFFSELSLLFLFQPLKGLKGKRWLFKILLTEWLLQSSQIRIVTGCRNMTPAAAAAVAAATTTNRSCSMHVRMLTILTLRAHRSIMDFLAGSYLLSRLHCNYAIKLMVNAMVTTLVIKAMTIPLLA